MGHFWVILRSLRVIEGIYELGIEYLRLLGTS